MEILIAIFACIIILAALAGNMKSHVEQPEYARVRAKGNIEIRDYAPSVLAEVEVSGERLQGIRKGFKALAGYIFGDNISNKKIAMTAPVIQEKEKDIWKVRFFMPKKYSAETLPKPSSKEVILVPTQARRMAVIRFSGIANDERIKQHTELLKAYILAEKLKPIGGTTLAFYNPPWTLPFLRRNEVMIEIGIDP